MTWLKKRQPRLPLFLWRRSFVLPGLPRPRRGSKLRAAAYPRVSLSAFKRPLMPLGRKKCHAVRLVMSTSKSFRCNTYRRCVCVAFKGLTKYLTSLDATLTKYTGVEQPVGPAFRGGPFFSFCNLSMQCGSHLHRRKLVSPVAEWLVKSVGKDLASNREKCS